MKVQANDVAVEGGDLKQVESQSRAGTLCLSGHLMKWQTRGEGCHEGKVAIQGGRPMGAICSTFVDVEYSTIMTLVRTSPLHEVALQGSNHMQTRCCKVR